MKLSIRKIYNAELQLLRILCKFDYLCLFFQSLYFKPFLFGLQSNYCHLHISWRYIWIFIYLLLPVCNHRLIYHRSEMKFSRYGVWKTRASSLVRAPFVLAASLFLGRRKLFLMVLILEFHSFITFICC